MTTNYVVASAHADIQARLTPIGTTLYALDGMYNVLLKELDPTKPLNQLGGIVKIRKFPGGLSVVGLAGRSLLKPFSETFGSLHPSWALSRFTSPSHLQHAINAGVLTNGLDPANWFYKVGATVKSYLAHQVIEETTFRSKTGWDEGDLIEELTLGWFTAAHRGTLYAGPAGVTVPPMSPLEFNITVPSMVLQTLIPVNFNFDLVDFNTQRTAYLDSIGSSEVRDYVVPAWDGIIGALRGQMRMNLPLLVAVSAQGIDIGCVFTQQTTLHFENITNSSAQPTGPGGYGKPYPDSGYVHVDPHPDLTASVWTGIGMPASCLLKGGIIIPKLDDNTALTLSMTSSTNFRSRLKLPISNSIVPNWPATIDAKSAAQVLAPLVPGCYAPDALVQPAGDLSLQTIYTSAASVNLGQQAVSENVETQDATVIQMPSNNSLITNMSGFGGAVIEFFAGKLNEVERVAEEAVRADKSFLG